MACTEPPRDIVNRIAKGLNERGATLAGAVMVEFAPREDEILSPALFFAAYIVLGGELEKGIPALWAIGPTGRGSIFAIDSPAREFTSWGEATHHDSRIAGAHSAMLDYPEAKEALDCLRRVPINERSLWS